MGIAPPPTARRRLWAEHIPLPDLGSPALLGMLARRNLQLVAAVRPSCEAQVTDLVRRCRGAGVELTLWPMLDDRDGRWWNASNHLRFGRFCEGLLARARRDDALPHELALDLEPPIAHVRRVVHGRWAPPRRAPVDPGPLRRLVARVRSHGVTPWAAVVPLVLADPPEGGGWQRLLGTPVDRVGFERVSPMLYTTLLLGYGRGFYRREDALVLLRGGAAACRRRFGPRAAVSLGAVGPGALGDEQTYAGPHELAEEVAIVRAAGIDDLSLFDLGGVLDRGPAEAWLDAFSADPTHAPKLRSSWRARGTVMLAWAIGRAAAQAGLRGSRA